jgi:hypothetical protein
MRKAAFVYYCWCFLSCQEQCPHSRREIVGPKAQLRFTKMGLLSVSSTILYPTTFC